MPQIYNSHVLLQPLTWDQAHDRLACAAAALPLCALASLKSADQESAHAKYMVHVVDDEECVQAVFKVHVLRHQSDADAVWLNFVPARSACHESRAAGRTAFCAAYTAILDHPAIAPLIVTGAVHPDYGPRYASEVILTAAVARKAAAWMKLPPLPPDTAPTCSSGDDAAAAIETVARHIYPLLFTANRAFAFKQLKKLPANVQRGAGVDAVVSAFMSFFVAHRRASLADLRAAWQLCGEDWLASILAHASTLVCAACTAKGWQACSNFSTPVNMPLPSFALLPCLVCYGTARA